MIDSATLLLASLSLMLYLYLYMSRVYSYFERQGVPHLKPVPFLGSYAPFIFGRISYAELSRQAYNKFSHCRFGGVFEMLQPAVVITDPDLLRQICVRDFDHFTDRFMVEAISQSTFSKSLANRQGAKWRQMRLSISPCFTASKMKMMFTLLNHCSRQLTDHLVAEYSEKQVNGILAIEARNLCMRHSADVVATVAYGANINSHTDRANMFYQSATKVIGFDWSQMLKAWLHMVWPTLMQVLRISVVADHITRFLNTTVAASIESRTRDGVSRPDMIHLLLQAKNGELGSKQEWDDTDLMAQCFIFFVAGYEAPSTSLTFLLLMLAANPDVQDRLRAEIDDVVPSQEDITYDTVKSMTYLDQVFKELLRLYPPAVVVNRACTKQYVIPATDCSPQLRIDPGVIIWLSIYAMHRDPRLYRDPHLFDPDRFSKARKHEIPDNAYIPFGAGPRKCIGERLAHMMLKIAVIHILQKFQLEANDRCQYPFKLSSKTLSMNIDGGSWINLSPRNCQ